MRYGSRWYTKLRGLDCIKFRQTLNRKLTCETKPHGIPTVKILSIIELILEVLLLLAIPFNILELNVKRRYSAG
jgi:hypothetical protein